MRWGVETGANSSGTASSDANLRNGFRLTRLVLCPITQRIINAHFKRFGFVLASLTFVSGIAFAFGANGTGWKISLTNPAPNGTFAPGATIGVYNGSASWTANDASIDDIGVFVLTNGGNPDTAVNWSSNYANWDPQRPAGGGGNGTINSKNVTPALTAPTIFKWPFNIVAIPENAVQGWYFLDQAMTLVYGDKNEETTIPPQPPQ